MDEKKKFSVPHVKILIHRPIYSTVKTVFLEKKEGAGKFDVSRMGFIVACLNNQNGVISQQAVDQFAKIQWFNIGVEVLPLAEGGLTNVLNSIILGPYNFS